MIYMHENNLISKIDENYHDLKNEIQSFYDEKYKPMREQVLKLDFNENNSQAFVTATRIFNKYYDDLLLFSNKNGIKSQSKFESTFLEEISNYLFKDLPEIKNGKLDIFNKGIFNGLMVKEIDDIIPLTKDVDFCIGKKVTMTINKNTCELIIPIIAVEVKTYLDKTMFGEVQFSSQAIRNSTLNSRTYILALVNAVAKEHIYLARQNSAVVEYFVLCKEKRKDSHNIRSEALESYWREISSAVEIESSGKGNYIPDFGKQLHP